MGVRRFWISWLRILESRASDASCTATEATCEVEFVESVLPYLCRFGTRFRLVELLDNQEASFVLSFLGL